MVFLITSFIISAQNEQILDTTILKNITHKIHSIDIVNDNTDLVFLKDELGLAEIFMLGEQSHGDGSTFLAKTRLIKYLHENLDFDVLVFESGLMDAYRVWEMIKKGNNSLEVFNHGIFPIWANSEQTEALFKYILEQSKTNNPLYIAGFDIQPTGSLVKPDKRWEELSSYLSKTANFIEEDFPMFTKVFKNISVVFSDEITADDFKTITSEFEKISTLVSEKDHSEKGKIIARYINNYFKTIFLYKNADLRIPTNTPHVFNIRDREMANNFIFLKEEMYPGKKLMVWGANSHLGYGRGFLDDTDDFKASAKGMIPMGQYLKIDYQNKLYSLAFTSYEGSLGLLKGQIRKLPTAHKLSLENTLVSLGFENAFISLNNNEFKNSRFAARIFGHAEMSGKWGQMCDGIFFIKTMIPNKQRTNTSN